MIIKREMAYNKAFAAERKKRAPAEKQRWAAQNEVYSYRQNCTKISGECPNMLL